MVDPKRKFPMAWSAALMLALAAGAAPAEDAGARMSAFGSEVAWSMESFDGRWSLVVAGGDIHETAEFAAGESPVFSLFDREGAALPDGTYQWELSGVREPVNDRVRDPENGRDSAEHVETNRIDFEPRVFSGSFTILNGAVVDPSLVEAQRGPRDEA